MEKSAPAPAAQDENAAPEETAAQKEKPARERRRIRVPTSVLVTLAGIALTAWLLPAFTRQWDDRQKAHDLQAEIVAAMASATAQAIVQTDRAETVAQNRAVARRQTADAWLLARLALEARLRAYFPAEVVASWNVYSSFVDMLVGVSEDQADAPLDRAIEWMLEVPSTAVWYEVEDRAHRHLPHEIAIAATIHIQVVRFLAKRKPPPLTLLLSLPTLDDYSRQSLTNDERIEIDTSAADSMTFAQWGASLFRFEADVAALVLDANPVGYSTTRRDLLHDLLP